MFKMTVPDARPADFFRTLDDALSEAQHWNLDEGRASIQNTESGAKRSVAEWRSPCPHRFTANVVADTGEQTTKLT
jgi:hypothetical protein